MTQEEPVNCRCGRQPERDVSLCGYKCSLSCMCGTMEINFLVRSDSAEKLLENWRSLILREPYKNHVQHLPNPDADVIIYFDSPAPHYRDGCPLRRSVRAMGGHCSGGGGAC